MAVYKLFPTKDTTIYSRYPARNTGLDSIIETSVDADAYLSRFLIQFSQDEINSLIDNRIGTSSMKVNLKTFIANIQNLNTDTTLEIYPISGSWAMGTGHLNDSPETDNGCSWTYSNYSGSSTWAIDNFEAYSTGSYGNVEGGGTWYTGSLLGLNVTQSQVYNYTSNKDLNVDVTNTIRTWYSASNSLGGFTNDGFIIKQSDNDEIGGLYKQAIIKFYSVDTNTIYPPELQFKWEDYIFNTGSSSNTIINTSELVVSLNNNPEEFRRESIHKFKIHCRPQFPSRTYQTSSIYATNYYLPISSSYAIKDLDTNEFVIDFDNDYTKISADASGSYFTLYMNGLEPERYYSILLKLPFTNETLVLDDNYYFKVING